MIPSSRIALALFVALSLSACGTSEASSFPIEPAPTTTTTAPAENYDVPATIDIAYLQRVMDRLMEIHGDVRRDVLATKTYTDRDNQRFDAMFDPPAYDFQTNLWRESAPAGDDRVRENPTRSQHTVLEIVIANSSCVWFKSFADDTQNMRNGQQSSQRADIVLKRRTHDQSVNPTPWVITQFAPEKFNIVDAGRACGV